MNTIFLVVFFASVLLLPAMKAFTIDDNDKNPTSSSNNENPSKSKKIITVKDKNGNKVKVRPLKSNCKGTNIDCVQAAEIVNDKSQHHNKIKETNGLFRGGIGNDGSDMINNIPVIATTTNGTTANVTIPVCNGVVGGPCLDPNTHTIIP